MERIGRGRHGGSADKGEERCPACASGNHAAWVRAGEVLEGLATEDGLRAYLAKEGVCRDRLLMMVRRAPDQVVDWLLEEAQRRIADLMVGLELYYIPPEDQGADLIHEEALRQAWRRELR